ncbi:MAG: ATP-binding protein [Oscillatoriaceae cyanobacterium Prado104]|nr:ATP-binding protein [Oscillatoriaceae cyanobacterium Prado104]
MKPKTLHRILPLATFEAAYRLLEQMAELPGAIFLGDEAISGPQNRGKDRTQRFAAVVSKEFSALLRGKQLDESPRKRETPQAENGSDRLNVELSFDPETIANFLSPIAEKLTEITPVPARAIDISALKYRIKNLKPNSADIQSEFTLNLLEMLAVEGNANSELPVLSATKIADNTAFKLIPLAGSNSKNPDEFAQQQIASSCASYCRPVEDALQQQLEQEQLLNEVISQIRQSLELRTILSQAVERVREFLEVDRLLIYQFEKSPKPDSESEATVEIALVPNSEELREDTSSRLQAGRVTYEALASSNIASVLNFSEGAHCFPQKVFRQEKYRKGMTFSVADVEKTYTAHRCFLELMRSIQVRAKLVVPIVVQEELWGLLIAHQSTCQEWEDSKKTFLKHIAEHLAIAIYQAELYAQVQQQKHTLKQRVIERTRELRDALAAAQSASLAKSEFLAAMSHELRTPLTCVIGISDTLLRWCHGKVDSKKLPLEKQRQYLQIIRDSGDHLLELINDILDLSQVEAGKTVLKISEFSLSKLAIQSLRAFKEKAATKEVDLVLDQQIEQHRDRFTADPRRVRQILFNLLGNAIKFTPKGGQVALRVWIADGENKMLPGRQQGTVNAGCTAIFQVKDTGIGIPENQRSLLFQKFQQLDSPYRRQHGGTGLGLALTKQLVELHGGAIEVNSTVDVGSTFTVFIPAQSLVKDELSRDKHENLNSPLMSHSALRGSIVLVEADEETAMLICNILTAAGMQVVWIIEGSAAVAQIELLQPNATIVDMRLPGMSGREIIHQLRQKPATQNIKILALTAGEIPAGEISAATGGADDCLVKPIHPQQLLDKVMVLMSSI